MGLQLKGFARLIEADMTIGADAQQLQVDAAQLVDDTVVTGTLGGSVQIGAVRQVGLGRVDIHLAEQVLVHEIPVALGVLLGQAAVLIQIDSSDLGEIQIAFVVPVHQLGISAHRGAAGGKTQYTVRLHDDLCGDDVGRFAGHILIIFCADDLHNNTPFIVPLRLRSGRPVKILRAAFRPRSQYQYRTARRCGMYFSVRSWRNPATRLSAHSGGARSA